MMWGMQGYLKTRHMDSIGEAVSVAVSDLTGIVIDSGEGSTDVVPIVSGYVVASAIRTVPLAGADATAYVRAALRDRGEPLPSEHCLDHCRCATRALLPGSIVQGCQSRRRRRYCRDIKHQYTYTVKDIRSEAAKLKANPQDIVREHCITDARTKPVSYTHLTLPTKA